jgi:hypothetical protein
MTEFTLEGKLTFQDYIDGILLQIKPRRSTRIVLAFVLIFFVLMFNLGIFLSFQGAMAFQLLCPSLLIPVMYAAWRYFFLPRRVKSIFAQQKELGSDFVIEISEDELKFSNAYGNSRRPWSEFVNWKEDTNNFLLYHSDVMQTIIPKRLFQNDAQVDYLRGRLVQNIVITKGSNRFRTLIVLFVLIMVIVLLVYQFRSPVY